MGDVAIAIHTRSDENLSWGFLSWVCQVNVPKNWAVLNIIQFSHQDKLFAKSHRLVVDLYSSWNYTYFLKLM